MLKKHTLPKALREDHLTVMIVTWFGSGLLKPASGTWGTITSLPFAVLLLSLGPMHLVFGAFITFIIGMHFVERAERLSQQHDSSYIVIDETVGMILAMLFCEMRIIDIGAAFVLFRIFDIVKPWPVSRLERLNNKALAVMSDDVAAGLIAALCIYGLKAVHVL